MGIKYQTGIPEELRGEVALLYDEAFGKSSPWPYPIARPNHDS